MTTVLCLNKEISLFLGNAHGSVSGVKGQEIALASLMQKVETMHVTNISPEEGLDIRKVLVLFLFLPVFCYLKLFPNRRLKNVSDDF